MLRNVLAVIVGMIAGMTVNLILVQLNVVFFPLPDGVDMSNSEQMKAFVATLPAVGWILPIVAHLGQAFVGGWVAARLGVSRPMTLALIVGGLSLAGGIANALMLAAPAWVWIEMPFYLVLSWLAGKLAGDRFIFPK